MEDNNSKVVSLFSFPDGESGMLTVAIKIDREDASSVLRFPGTVQLPYLTLLSASGCY